MFTIERMIDGRKHYYAGYASQSFSDSGCIWNTTRGKSCKFTEPVADAILRQLVHMGITDATKAMVFEKRGRRGHG